MKNLNKKQRRVKIPKDYYGNPCWECKDLAKAGTSQAKIDDEHENCHGWYHCGAECCGTCNVCGR